MEPEFRGFEIYYKIYEPTSEYIEERIFESQYDMALAGFRRLTNATDNTASPQIPLLPVDPADQGDIFEITVDFGNPDIPMIFDDDTPSVPIDVAEVRRVIFRTTPPTQYKPFNEWDSMDADISQTIYNDYIKHDPFPSAVMLRLFVLSFGLDFTGALYSKPVWIGDSNIVFEDSN